MLNVNVGREGNILTERDLANGNIVINIKTKTKTLFGNFGGHYERQEDLEEMCESLR